MTLDAKTAVQRFFDVIDEPVGIEDPAKPKTISEPKGKLEFKNVHFRYLDSPASQTDLINGVNLVIEPGESVALIGVTGSGKTTLTALTSRLYDVTSGSIEVDGVDIRELTRSELRSHVAMAFEDATLFSASVRDNILLGREHANEQELEEAIGTYEIELHSINSDVNALEDKKTEINNYYGEMNKKATEYTPTQVDSFFKARYLY
jgi:ATP-binding cassette subfamily B protein